MSDVYAGAPSERSAPDGIQHGIVVAVVLTWRGRIGLFKRSWAVGSDAGLWHCVTGYVEQGVPAGNQALCELFEETGLCVVDLTGFRAGPVLRLADPRGGFWTVHTFHAQTERRRLELNWEHLAYRWVRPCYVARFTGQVPWLRDALHAVLTPDDSAGIGGRRRVCARSGS
ncbi:NUDIX domain-containing protein [Streptomyces sp. E5N91]|uniref:NUDIX domain-containing protein n=1 Tax=Streptomyces sp. E5N91 TaxID=1851996 RepID=UPI000EF5E079|nr:NUDIX domain-containing protein [Streptomyces sp. E5N91]